ncbi:MAG: SpoIIE family protein phosphatase [Bacteroidota bacterium]
MEFWVLLLAVLLIFVFIGFFSTKKKLKKQQEKLVVLLENETKTNSILAVNNNWEKEKEALLIEKQKAEEKNKKLWQMSETVHKERKQVDEANELLLTDKQKLEADKKKLDEKVKKLWAQSVSIHKEKERINELKLVIEHKHQEILDSVNYAQRIQRALLASKKMLKDNLPDYFVLFLPKDIVSGDFYWANQLNNNQFSIVTADSTGHGVPGAIMSILNISSLSEAVNAQQLVLPNQILDYTRKRIMEHMANDGSEEGGKDGMDAVICNFDFIKNKLQFAAANNPLWLIRDNILTEYKPDKMPVGKAMGEIKPFTLHELELQKGDLIITLTDGYADQFGGEKNKKFMYKSLKDLLLKINNNSLEDIKNQLKTTFEIWKGNAEQVDDVLIIGIRL